MGGGRDFDYLSLSNTNCIKGIFALFVLVHHLYQYSKLFLETYLSTMLQGLGYVSVAVFFFLSGYGLRVSHISKGQKYVKSLPIKRILPLYLQCMLLIGMYTILYVAIGKEVRIELISQSFLWGATIVAGGWYLQTILVLYFLYYLVYGVWGYNRIKSERKLHIVMLVALTIYILICTLFGKAITWYQSIFGFMLGIIWCDYREWFDKKLNRHWVVSGITAFIAFAILFLAGLKIKYFTILVALAFDVLAMIFLMRIPVNCGVTRWLGRYYFEIYVMQGISLLLFHSDQFYIDNKWLYVFVCILTTLLFAVIIHPVFHFISNVIKWTKFT